MSGRLFAVIPAAGLSRRMGRPKLTLELGGKSVIRRLLETLEQAGVSGRLIVCRNDDRELFEEIEAAGATVVTPGVHPPDMRTSVECALDVLRTVHRPEPDEGWMLAPADHPVLSVPVVRRLVEQWADGGAAILVPTFDGRRGHPTLFRWSLADRVRDIPADCGLNHLLRQFPADVVEYPVDDPCVLADLDTPADFARLQRESEG
ncbi:MAG: NTP transferase domain-containing protein [Planctomycetaceae bacterium]